MAVEGGIVRDLGDGGAVPEVDLPIPTAAAQTSTAVAAPPHHIRAEDDGMPVFGAVRRDLGDGATLPEVDIAVAVGP